MCPFGLELDQQIGHRMGLAQPWPRPPACRTAPAPACPCPACLTLPPEVFPAPQPRLARGIPAEPWPPTGTHGRRAWPAAVVALTTTRGRSVCMGHPLCHRAVQQSRAHGIAAAPAGVRAGRVRRICRGAAPVTAGAAGRRCPAGSVRLPAGPAAGRAPRRQACRGTCRAPNSCARPSRCGGWAVRPRRAPGGCCRAAPPEDGSPAPAAA